MGIPEDYYRETGETLRQACERMRKTHLIGEAAIAIGYGCATSLREALRKRGIVVEWARSPLRHRAVPGRGPRITPEQMHRYAALYGGGMKAVEAARQVGAGEQSLRRAMQRELPELFESIRRQS